MEEAGCGLEYGGLIPERSLQQSELTLSHCRQTQSRIPDTRNTRRKSLRRMRIPQKAPATESGLQEVESHCQNSSLVGPHTNLPLRHASQRALVQQVKVDEDFGDFRFFGPCHVRAEAGWLARNRQSISGVIYRNSGSIYFEDADGRPQT